MKIALTVSPDIRLVVLEGKKLSFTDVHVTQTLATTRTNSIILESDEEAEQEFSRNVSTYNMVDIDADKDDQVLVVRKIIRQAVINCAEKQTASLEKQLSVLPF